MTTLRVSFAELLSRETAQQAAARQDVEYREDWTAQRLSHVLPSQVERAMDRVDLPRCPPRPAIVVPEQWTTRCAFGQRAVRCVRRPMRICPAVRRRGGQ